MAKKKRMSEFGKKTIENMRASFYSEVKKSRLDYNDSVIEAEWEKVVDRYLFDIVKAPGPEPGDEASASAYNEYIGWKLDLVNYHASNLLETRYETQAQMRKEAFFPYDHNPLLGFLRRGLPFFDSNISFQGLVRWLIEREDMCVEYHSILNGKHKVEVYSLKSTKVWP